MEGFGSLITAMVTPFDRELKINWEVVEELVLFLCREQKSDALVVCGTTGESPTLTGEEKITLFREVRRHAPSECRIIAGTGSNSTPETIRLSREAEKCGVDALMVVTPYYNKPQPEALIHHYQAVAGSVSLPVMIYNVPSRTGCDISADVLIRLGVHPGIVALKEAGGDLDKITRVKKELGEGLQIYSGNDNETLPILSLGGEGVVSVASHIAGREIKEMIEFFRAGETREALFRHQRLHRLFKGLFAVSNPVPIKAALNMLGIKAGGVRPPLLPLREEEKKKLYAIMEEQGLI